MVLGSLLQLYLLSMFFITASLGMGITISNITENQMQAEQGFKGALYRGRGERGGQDATHDTY